MNLIERYIFKRAGVAAMVILGSLVGVIWIVQALRELDVVTTKGQTVLAYLALTTFAIPMLVLAVIPVALLLATVFAVNTLNANSELVVINASGASGWILTKPLLVLALICCLLTGAVGHFISPWSLTQLKVFVTKMRADLVQVIIREGTFNEVEKGLYFHIAKRDAGGVLRGILISDEREANESTLLAANTGFVSRVGGEAVLFMRDGEIHQRTSESDSVTVIRFQSYAFDLSTLSGQTSAIKIRPKERSTPDLFRPDPEDPYFKERPGLYRAQIHERFSEMIWPFTYVIVVLAFAGQARSNRQSHGSAIGSALMVVTLLRGAAFSVVSSTKADDDLVWLVYALPLSGILAGSWYLVTSRPVTLPAVVQARVDAAGEAMQVAAQDLQARYLRWRRSSAEAGA